MDHVPIPIAVAAAMALTALPAPAAPARPVAPPQAQDPAAGSPAASEVIRARNRSGPSDTLYVSEVIEAVRETNPRVRAARLEAEAARLRVPAAGAPSDPTLQLGLMNRPLDDFAADERMTMDVVGVSQRLRWPGALAFAERRAGHVAAATEWQAAETEVALVARAQAAYWRISFLDRSLAVLGETRGLLQDFLDVSAARYAVGEGVQQDVLQAQVAIGRIRADLEATRQERRAAAGRLNALLGRPADAPVGPVEYREPGPPPPAVERLMEQAAERRPALRAARERIAAAEAGRRAAARAARPDMTVSLAWARRARFDDMASVMIGIDVPLFAGRREGAESRARAAERARADAAALDLHHETWARLVELAARADRARTLFDLFRTAILPQAEAAVESALSAYRVGKVDYMTLVESELTVNSLEIESARLAAEYQEALAGIDALTGDEGEDGR